MRIKGLAATRRLGSRGGFEVVSQAIIDYYNIVSDLNNKYEKFVYSDGSDKSYPEVAKELARGEFVPDKLYPENLPAQNACKNVFTDVEKLSEGNQRDFKDLISHTWDHEMFRKRRNL